MEIYGFYNSGYLFVLQIDFQYHSIFDLPGLFNLYLVQISNMTFLWHPVPWQPGTLDRGWTLAPY